MVFGDLYVKMDRAAYARSYVTFTIDGVEFAHDEVAGPYESGPETFLYVKAPQNGYREPQWQRAYSASAIARLLGLACD